MSPAAAWTRAALTAVVVLIADQVAKQLVIHGVTAGSREQLLLFVDLVNVRNSGVAFGALEGGGILVGVVVTVALIALLVFFSRHATQPLAWLPVGLLLGGALGNALDRIRIGAVVDYIKVPNWPAFNVADIAITVGVVLLVVVIERGAREDAAPSPA
ncbi:MAG: signal peptidase II [Solirubrobacteraceae bacterium]|nr:signal peptidase II [Solirubrobacteraceae bacterium]